MMRRLIAMCVLVLVIVLGGGLASTAAAQGTVFLVRHAERADDANAGPKMTGTDPDLSGQGVLRAQALARTLKDAKITAIYTTEYKRTRQTAAPLATALGVQVTEVSSKDLPGLFQKVRTAPGNVLVVGHSNTVPAVIKELGVAEPVSIAETEYDNLFVVTKGTLIRLRY